MSAELNLNIGDRVRHADGDERTGTITRFLGYPLARVMWDVTGRESAENFHLLVKVDD